MANTQDVKINGMGFNIERCSKMTEAEFIKDQLPSVPDQHGDDEKKTALLKEAYAKIMEAVKPVKASPKAKNEPEPAEQPAADKK